MIGVPGYPGAIQRARIDVAGAFMIRQEEQPPADQHRAGQLPIQARQHPGEGGRGGGWGIIRGGRPQLAGPAAAVPLPVRGLVGHAAGQQRGALGFQGQVIDRAERQQAGRGVAGTGDREGPAVLHGRLAGRGDGQHLVTGRPSGDPGLRVAPEGEPGRVTAVGVRGVDLRAPVPPAGPGHPGPVPGETRIADLGRLGGQPPRAAAHGRREPHVLASHEGDQLTAEHVDTEDNQLKPRTSS